MEAVLDRDTANLAGAPDIAQSILAKISMADVFVADVSIINAGAPRQTPNPNVLIELGYAVAELGWDKIILVQNKVFGGPESLPFDLRGRRTVVYEADADSNRTEVRRLLQGRLETALRVALDRGPHSNLATGQMANLWWGTWKLDVAPSVAGILCIREVGASGVLFDLDVVHGAHTGSVTAYARIVSQDRAYCRLPNGESEADGELVFHRRMDSRYRIIDVEETAPCNYFHGQRASFTGSFVREREPWFDAGFMNELELMRLYAMVGEHMDKMRSCTSDVSERDNLDQELAARVVCGGVAGLYTIMESIVLFNSMGAMWAAYIDDEKVRYFTNVPAYREAVPKTIIDWRKAFADKPIEYCEPKNVVPDRDV